MAEPTDNERRMAEIRHEIAANKEDQMAIAMAILGEAKRYARWVLKDADGLLPDRVYYCADLGDGKGWQPASPNDQERRTTGEPVLTASGEKHFLFRWRTYFDFIGAADKTYSPKTAEQLADMRVKREARAKEKLAEDMPLFADQIMTDSVKLVKSKNQLRRRSGPIVPLV